MLRRTKDTIINGKPIVDLPARLISIIDCEFDRVQREFYASVDEKVQKSLENLQKGDINKAYTSVLVLLLRLRQGEHDWTSTKDELTNMSPSSLQSSGSHIQGLQERRGGCRT